jgi:renalase
MTALAEAMATGLEIRQLAQVTGIARQSDGWHLRVGDGEVIASRLILTVPAPQAAALLGADHPLQGALRAVRMDPCLTLMAGVRAPAPYLTRKEPEDALSWIAQDSSKPGRPGGDVTAWVAQAGTAFSRQHLETDPAGIAALMLPMLAVRLGVALDTVTHASAHRWRYARAVEPLGRPFLRDDDARLYLGGDWCLGPRVEAAWTSGTAIAEDMLARMA